MKKLVVIFIFFTLSVVGVTYANHSKGLHIQLPDKTIDISTKEIEEAQQFKLDDKHFGVMLRLNSAAGTRLTQATRNLRGKDALWIWNGRAVYMQKLQAPLDTDINVLNLTAQEANEISSLGQHT